MYDNLFSNLIEWSSTRTIIKPRCLILITMKDLLSPVKIYIWVVLIVSAKLNNIWFLWSFHFFFYVRKQQNANNIIITTCRTRFLYVIWMEGWKLKCMWGEYINIAVIFLTVCAVLHPSCEQSVNTSRIEAKWRSADRFFFVYTALL